MNSAPTPSPIVHTPSAQITETPRAQVTLRPRPQISPTPIATCRVAKMAFHTTLPLLSTSATWKSAVERGPGSPMFAMPRMPAIKARLNMYGWNCRAPSSSQSTPRATSTWRRRSPVRRRSGTVVRAESQEGDAAQCRRPQHDDGSGLHPDAQVNEGSVKGVGEAQQADIDADGQ